MRLDWRWLVLSITLTAGIPAQNLPMPGKPSDSLAAAKVFDYASLAVTHNPNGSERRDVVSSGRLATGEPVHIHASMQPPGVPPGQAHTIEHSEFILVTEGTLESRPGLLMLAAAALATLLIVCANIGRLSLVESSRRRCEVAARAARGATRGRIVAARWVNQSCWLSLGELGGTVRVITPPATPRLAGF